eukprot:TRINITY_DN3465_c0_g1_i3.p1 TRINITY_DN3465_c0_g1~~TRINITY_DN3465_c0_g1_i3.p1  ORF type:complete len:529 (+),score=3.47 TRINITY_DN3465_c0_g1_i3:141-1589(+)
MIQQLSYRGYSTAIAIPLQGAQFVEKFSKNYHNFQLFKYNIREKFKASDVQGKGFIIGFWNTIDDVIEQCYDFLIDAFLQQQLQAYKPEILVSDVCFFRCTHMLAVRLNISIIINSSVPPMQPYLSFYGYTPHYTSMTTTYGFGLSALTDKYSMTQRGYNLLGYMFHVLIETILDMYHNELWNELMVFQGVDSAQQSAQKRVLLILQTGHFTVNEPMPLSPHVKFIGSTMSKTAGQIQNSNLLAFLKKNQDAGVLYCSFGTNLRTHPQLTKLLITVFSNLPFGVLWSTSNLGLARQSNLSLPTNLLIQSWVPQNDILGSPYVKGFLMQGGWPSIMEASYHGVPLVIIPQIIDQYHNAYIIERAGLGIRIQNQSSVEEITMAINEIMTNQKYVRRAQIASILMQRESRNYASLAADYVEDVIQSNFSRHLLSQVNDMQWYQFYNVDVYVCIFVFMAVGIYLSISLIIKTVGLFIVDKGWQQKF